MLNLWQERETDKYEMLKTLMH